MKKENEMALWLYMEVMIQFGFIALFANTFTLAPFFSFLTNLLEIRI